MTDSATTIGIVGASGWLGRAFAKGIVERGLACREALWLSSRTPEAAAASLPGARWTADNQALVDACRIVVLSVRPEQFDGIRADARGKTVVSFMAGVPMRVVADRLGTSSVVRAMPNAAVDIGRSYTPWFAAPSVPQGDKDLVQAILSACGTADEMSSEFQIDYMTGLTGSGPAFPALLADAMIRDAMGRGFDPDVARRAVVAVVAGASQMLEGPAAPSQIVDTFLDYRGTTAAAIRAMLDGGFREAVGDGLRAAEARVVLTTPPS